MAREARHFVDEAVLLHFVVIVIAPRVPPRPLSAQRSRLGGTANDCDRMAGFQTIGGEANNRDLMAGS